MKINLIVFCTITCALGAAALLQSCADNTPPPVQNSVADTVGVSTSGTMNYEGEIISVPSPIQIAMMIQKSSLPFKQNLINGLQNKGRYLNETSKSLNLGIYGADLAYVANYNLGQINIDYFDAIASISSELGILENLDKKLVTKLNSNLSNRDSILKLNSEFFRMADRYLKTNQRSQLSSYILIGGWVESVHLAADASIENAEFRLRLGEQKYTAPSILRLSEKLSDPAFDKVKGELIKLCEMFTALQSSYSYKQPINDQREKKTYLRSQSVVNIDEEQANAIREQIRVVRNLIIE
ncbi:MAG: hypothetical protein IPP69_16405 [Flavobacteriales bacterium]|nr:hypothetical protein [Flavobacteriales bacterium]